MISQGLKALLDKAENEGWQLAFGGSMPRPGVRVDVMHVLNRSYDTTGEVDAAGKWRCANGFVLPDGRLLWDPTHWRDTREAEYAPAI